MSTVIIYLSVIAENECTMTVLDLEMWSECADLDLRCRTCLKLDLLTHINFFMNNLVNCSMVADRMHMRHDN